MDVSDTITLVGRERELRVLRSELAEAGRGSARLAFVVGEPGIGKTHTILALAARAAREGTAVAWGRAHEGGAAPL
ncbi:MAG: ATP-binding protein, partial [Myxococcales bacterium]|nr:ATP-binding protein [Myxococcales bacterium]